MNIVANTYFLSKLRNLSFFTLDLGKTRKLMNDDRNRFRKLDEFQIRYNTLYNRSLMNFGNIANKVIFYEDVNLTGKNLIIFKDTDIYEIEWNDSEIENIESYILETLRKVDDADKGEIEQEEANYQKIEEYSADNDVWVAPDSDLKNSGKSYMVNQTLSRKEYREEMIKKVRG